MSDKPSGILVIDKPEGKTSSFVDFLCKKILNIRKAGHLGTLDPFATGILPIAINSGTKLIPYIKTERKTYEFEIKFGEQTDSGDKTGNVIKTSEVIPDYSEIEKVIQKFIGKITQVPSPFSAIKINGRPAYEMARRGQIPKMKPRVVDIFNIELIDVNKLRAEVSPGTYIRTLTEDIAKALGTVAHTSSLRRIKDGRFGIEASISLDELEKRRDNISGILVSPENVLDDIPVILISIQDTEDLLHGRSIEMARCPDGVFLASSEGGFLEIVESSGGFIKPKKLLRANI